MPTNSVSARFQELFPETNLISLLTKYGLAAGKGREIPDADVADEVPVGGAGKGVDIRSLDAEKADERFLLVGVVLILKRLENIARVAAVLGQRLE